VGASGAVIRLGIYSPSSSTGLPSTLVLDAGTVDATSTGYKQITISQSLNAGHYYLCALSQGATCVIRSDQGVGIGVGNVNYSSNSYVTAQTQDCFNSGGYTTGGYPSTLSEGANLALIANSPRLQLGV
jgi:hypothetical protein